MPLASLLTELSAGFVLGLSAGLTPGPLSVLVLSQSLRHGVKEGIKVAIAPILTDLPIVILCLTLAGGVTRIDGALAVLTFGGAVYLAYLAYESVRALPPSMSEIDSAPRSLQKGALVNVLNPHPYLFWLTVGASIVFRGYAEGGTVRVIAFVAPFYAMLVGSKVMLAVLAGRSGRALPVRVYGAVTRGLAVLLAAFATLLLLEGVDLLRQ